MWCLTSLSAIIQLYRGCHFSCWRKLEYQENAADLPQVTSHHSMHMRVHYMFYIIIESIYSMSICFWFPVCVCLIGRNKSINFIQRSKQLLLISYHFTHQMLCLDLSKINTIYPLINLAIVNKSRKIKSMWLSSHY